MKPINIVVGERAKTFIGQGDLIYLCGYWPELVEDSRLQTFVLSESQRSLVQSCVNVKQSISWSRVMLVAFVDPDYSHSIGPFESRNMSYLRTRNRRSDV